MAETRQKILPTVIYRIFQIKFQQIHLISVSCHCKCCIFKMCQNVAAISITSQFHEFFNSNFGGLVRLVALEVASAASPAQQPPPKMTGSISKCSCSFRSLSKIVRKMGCHTAVPHVEKSAQKNKLTQADFTNFSMQDSPYTHSVSGCLSFTFKICQTVAGTSMIRQFHEFFKISFLAVFLNLAL